MSGSGALMTAGALATMSVAYRLGGLTSLLVGKTVELAAGQAIELTMRPSKGEPGYQTIYKHSVQYTLMELDVEANVAAVRSLVRSIECDHPQNEYVKVPANSMKEIMNKLMDTLHRIYNELDAHAQRWFCSYRSPDVFEDLELLRTQCKVFDKRLDTLIKCLSIPTTPPKSTSEEMNDKFSISEHVQQLSQLSFYAEDGEELNKANIENRTSSILTTETVMYKDDAVLL